MNNNLGPPKKVPRLGTPLPRTGDTTTSAPTPTLIRISGQCDCRPGQRQCSRNIGRYAHGWQDGFRRGRVDALRCAMREVDDLDVLAVLTALADEYELAAGGDQ